MDTQYSSRGVKLITYLNLEPRLRMNGAIPSFPQVLKAICLIKHTVHYARTYSHSRSDSKTLRRRRWVLRILHAVTLWVSRN